MKIKFWQIFIITLIFIACNNGDIKFDKHESGLEYKIVTKGEGKQVNIGDILILHLVYETEDGVKIFNSADTERKYLRKLEAPKHTGGSFENGLALLHVGDSAIFRINAESFLKFSESYSNLPKNVDKSDKIIIKLKLIDILKHEEFDTHLEERFHESSKVEHQILEKFLKNASIDIDPTESGLYYIELTKGIGDPPNIGDIITVNYTVKLIDGFVIETTYGKSPFTFQYGPNGSIDAWFEGLSYMSEGGKAEFICPSEIAYGEKGTKDIPPFSTIIFEVELISIERTQ